MLRPLSRKEAQQCRSAECPLFRPEGKICGVEQRAERILMDGPKSNNPVVQNAQELLSVIISKQELHEKIPQSPRCPREYSQRR